MKEIASVCNKLQKLSVLTHSSIALGLMEQEVPKSFSNGALPTKRADAERMPLEGQSGRKEK